MAYIVKSGDNLSRIASQNGMTLQQLLQLNPQFQANPSLIKPGQVVNTKQTPASQTPQQIQQQIDKLKQQVQAAQTAGYGEGGQYAGQQIPDSVFNQGKKSDPKQPLTDEEYESGASEHPKVAESIASGNTLAQIESAASSGDFSGLKNQYGQPFSVEEQTKALEAGMEDNRLFYEAQQAKEKADTESALAQKQQDYQDYLLSSGEKFAEDKSSLDQNAADTGMLFSTARNQREQKLQQSYQQEGTSKLGTYGRNVSDIARNYQYQYGKDAAGGLSQYYNAPTNTYNPNVATNGVSAGGLSSVYNPSQNNFGAGTVMGQRSSLAKQFAARKLGNQGNKLLASGYTNQF